jgi:hypothetical protein
MSGSPCRKIENKDENSIFVASGIFEGEKIAFLARVSGFILIL